MQTFDYTRAINSSLLLTEELGYQEALDLFLANCEEYYQTGDTSVIWELWENSMGKVQDGFLYAGRRLLLKWLFQRISDDEWLKEHVQNLKLSNKTRASSLVVQTDPDAVIYRKAKNEQYVFKTDMESVAAMSTKEENACCNLIRDLVGGSKDDLTLIKDAFRANRTSPMITKQQAFSLGHLLSFTLEEMQEFLMRMFQGGSNGENEEYCCNQFNPKSSGDLIEYYCFRFQNQDPDELKKEYKCRFECSEKESLFSPESFEITEEIRSYVVEEIPAWKDKSGKPMDAESRKEAFLQWLGDNSRYLDVPSQSATQLARLLARKCLQVMRKVNLEVSVPCASMDYPLTSNSSSPLSLPIVPTILKNEYEKQILAKEGWTNRHWASLASDLKNILCCLENNDSNSINEKMFKKPLPGEGYFGLQENQRDIESSSLYSFFVPKTREATWTKLQGTKNRLVDILSGNVPPQKSDILFLLFILANLIWSIDIWPARELPQMIQQFETAAKELLNRDHNGFPAIGEFYVAHFTEFAILSSIVYSAITDNYYLPLCCYLQLLISHD